MFDLTVLKNRILNFEKDYKKYQPFVDFIRNLTIDNNGESLALLEDDFNMYISISKRATNALPKEIIQNYIFNDFIKNLVKSKNIINKQHIFIIHNISYNNN